MGTIVISKPEKKFLKRPECRGILSVGKHRDKPICRKCRGRGWGYETPKDHLPMFTITKKVAP